MKMDALSICKSKRFRRKCLLIFTSLIVMNLSFHIGIVINRVLSRYDDVPVLENTWWGPGIPEEDNIAIIPFKIAVSDEVLQDLKKRLNNARPFAFTPPLETAAPDYIIKSNFLEKTIDFWKTKYDWKKREKLLNKHPQFKTQIQGLDIHYFHAKPKTTTDLKILPLLLIHGFPGSVKEFHKMIPMITTPKEDEDFSFEVIVPSLPGFGFSQGPAKSGLDAVQMAEILKNLMQRLGFDKFYVHGENWGAVIATNMGKLYEEHVLGIHLNGCVSSALMTRLIYFMGSLFPPAIATNQHEHKMYGTSISIYYNNILSEYGYLHMQVTKPDTIGIALNDSPVGLAAFIIEKIITWTNPLWRSGSGLIMKFKYEDLLDNVMIYWVTNSITTSARLYAEAMSTAHYGFKMGNVPVKVPTACGRLEHEQPDYLLMSYKYHNLIQTTQYNDTGHFSSFEAPELVVGDIMSAIWKMEIDRYLLC